MLAAGLMGSLFFAPHTNGLATPSACILADLPEVVILVLGIVSRGYPVSVETGRLIIRGVRRIRERHFHRRIGSETRRPVGPARRIRPHAVTAWAADPVHAVDIKRLREWTESNADQCTCARK